MDGPEPRLVAPARLTAVFEEAQQLGFLGPGPVERHMDHSLGFVELLQGLPAGVDDRPILDLGSGGGIPGLVIASVGRSGTTVLLEGSVRRCAWLQSAAEHLGMAGSVLVIGERAEVVGRARDFRYGFGAVVARLFGRPAVTAECAAPLLGEEGTLIVSEPASGNIGSPGAGTAGGEPGTAGTAGPAARWPADGLGELGLGRVGERSARGYSFVTVSRLAPCSDRYPRRTGIPAKRPLF
jgi:16S rRNA (guanine527-N7)-methyltransferase